MVKSISSGTKSYSEEMRYSLYPTEIKQKKTEKTICRFGAEIELMHGYKAKNSNRINWKYLLKDTLCGVAGDPKSVVYKISNINKLNCNGEHKFYIGKTTKSISDRWRSHVRSSLRGRGCPRLGNKIRKYGINSFKVEILYRGPHINTKEHAIIKELQANEKKIGYNIAN